MCKLAFSIIPADSNIIPPIVQLHARELLPDLEDCFQMSSGDADNIRLRVFSTVAEIVNEHKLQVVRVAYTNRGEIAKFLQPSDRLQDGKLYNLLFSSLQIRLQAILERTLVVPVKDGIPSSSTAKAARVDKLLIDAFAAGVRYIHHLRQHPEVRDNIALRNSENLAESTFVDSAHSTLLQLTDIVAYMLLKLDQETLEPSVDRSAFHNAVVCCGQSLNSGLLSASVGRLDLQMNSISTNLQRDRH